MNEIFVSDFPLKDRLISQEEVKIKFICGSKPFQDLLHINPSYWTLKSWYKRHGAHNTRIKWLPTIYNDLGLDESSLSKILEKEEPHIICFSVYLWNYELYDRLGRFLRQQYPNMIMIAGGAQIFVHRELDMFWNQYPWLDCAVYGDGEEAYRIIIDSIIDSSTVKEQATNISYTNQHGRFLQPFKRFKDHDFTFVSPFIDNKEEVTDSIKEIKKTQPNLRILMNYERVKGCPYKCSFCDWSSGLHNKVTQKQYDWKKDLDFFCSIDVSPRMVDANLGMFKEDIDVIKYIIELEDINPNFRGLGYGNNAKLHKKAVFEIIDLIETARPGEKLHTFAVQDIDKEVLDAIDRPDIPWHDLVSMIEDMKAKHSKFMFRMETIIGLPGQTVESFAEMMSEFSSIGSHSVIGNIWDMLVNSPAYDKGYQQKHGLRVIPAMDISHIGPEISKRDDIIDKKDCVIGYSGNFVLGTSTANMGDIMAMLSMVYAYNVLNNNNPKIFSKIAKSVFSNVVFWKKQGNMIARELEKDLQRYGKIILLPNLNGKPVTFPEYFSNKEILTTLIKGAYKV